MVSEGVLAAGSRKHSLQVAGRRSKMVRMANQHSRDYFLLRHRQSVGRRTVSCVMTGRWCCKMPLAR